MMPPRHRASPWTLALAVAGAMVGCHQCGPGDGVGWDSDLVGGACERDGHCVERCLEGGDFPGGTCSLRCDEDAECPDSTFCVDEAGGVCLLACDVDDDCRRGYACEDVDRRGHPGKSPVCIDD